MPSDTVVVERLSNHNFGSDAEFLEMIYKIILQREIDPREKEEYGKRLKNAYSKEQVVMDLLNSDELKNTSVSWLCGDEAIEFIEENKRFWDNQDSLLKSSPRNDTYIIVPFFHPDPTFCVRNAIIAKYLQKHYNCKIIGITLNDRLREIHQRLADSFGMKDCFVLDGTLPCEGRGELQSRLGSDPIRQGLLSLKFDDIPVGDLIYDTYLRNERMGSIELINDKLECYYLFAYRLFDAYRSIFDKYKGKVIATVQDHIVYILWGILARLAHSRGATVFANQGRSSPLILRKFDQSDSTVDHILIFLENSFQFIHERLTDKDEERGFQIVNNYYRNKINHQRSRVDPKKYRHYTRCELLSQLRMDPNKPTVFVMAHVMPDAPHGQGWMLYEDYYQWLLQTLEIIKGIPEVNWVVKSHPHGPLYTDRFTTPTAVAPYENRYQHIRHGPVDMHPGSLLDAADAVVTIRGTAGLEAAVFGKPCVLAGKSQYSGHGIAIEPQTEAEYIAALKALENPKPLSAEAIRRAKAFSYINLELARVQCVFLPELPSASKTNIPDSEQWSYMTDRLHDTRIENDPLYKNLMTQLELDFPHLLNFDKLVTSQPRPSEELPLVSVLTVCKNSEQTIRRCIESILSQDYANIEYVIQDGASTDGTLAIINEYIEKYGEIIKLHSEPDSGPNDAMFRGLCNCSGKIITLCWSDEELLPGAVSWGIENMARHPEAGAIYGDVYVTDFDGNITGPGETAKTLPWDLEKYICWERFPNYCGSFFRSSALRESGFFKFKKTDCCMYDYYAKVGIRYPIIYVPGWVGKFAVHSTQLSSTPSVLRKMLNPLESSIDHLMDDPATPEHIRSLRLRAYAGIRLAMLHSLVGNAGAYEDAKQILRDALKYKPDPCYVNQVLKETSHVCAKRGKYIDALDFLNIVRQHNFTVPELDYQRAKIFTRLGRVTEAIKAGFDELRLNPEHRGAQAIIHFSGNYSQGINELQNGKPAEALLYLDRAKQACQQFPNLEFARATAFAQLGKLDSAKEACEAELSLNVDDHSARKFLERLNLAMKGIPC